MTRIRTIVGLVLTGLLVALSVWVGPSVLEAAPTYVDRLIRPKIWNGSLTLPNAESINNDTDDMIDFIGAGGLANTDMRIDLDGPIPVLSSPSGAGIGINDVFGTTHAAPAALAAGVATFAVTTNVMTIDCDGGGNSITTITGGISGQILVLIHVDAHCTYVDNNLGAANTIDLLGANNVSADDETLTLVNDGTSWRELANSVND